MVRSFSIALLVLAFLQARSCGFTPEELKGEGEACTRSSECEALLECRGGVCMLERLDAGMDAGPLEAGTDPLDGAALDGAALDDAALDGSALDDAALDGSALDGSALDGAAPIDAG